MRRPRFATAKQVFETFAPARDEIAADPGDAEPLAFLQLLANGPTPEDAIGFCSYLLPRREAVWWGCQCIRSSAPPVAERDIELLRLSERWVEVPEEENRRAALTAGMAAAVKSAAAWTALAAAWSGGSMVEDPERPVPPPNFLTAHAVRAAVLTALAQVGPKERGRHLAAAVERAIKLIDASAP
ncbi:MAG: DUF6931 family protein [Hyphomicrobiales bacterium]